MRMNIKKCTATNGRFGVMAAVTPQTILCGNERLYPAGSLVGAATTPSRWDVVGNAGQRGALWKRAVANNLRANTKK